MRPSIDVRARGAVPVLGAICLATTTLMVLPTTDARSDSAARVAEVNPGHSRLNVIAGRRASVAGRTRPALAGQPVLLQRRGGHGWVTIARATTRAGGTFTLRFRPRKPASSRLRLIVDAKRHEIGRLNVYRRTSVSWYGPGLYGNKLSCGGRLTPGTRARLGFGGVGSVLVAS